MMNMMKKVLSVLICLSMIFTALPAQLVFADGSEDGVVTISNQYIKVSVNRENGGYVISTLEGDILKKSDNNKDLMHRGENMDTSFTSLRIDSKDYVFGNSYGFLGSAAQAAVTEVSAGGDSVTTTWSVKNIEVTQKISLVNSEASEQLGTALISYTVKNKGETASNIKSRILIDTQLGDKDYGYYEVPKQNLGQGYEYFESEQTWDSEADPTIRMPSDYFVRDNPYSSSIVGFGVNSVFEDQKPYKMTFAHWGNIAATVFDYEPDVSLNFTNALNKKKTADSAAALYYDLGTIAAGGEKTFSTYYGVTANLKNKDNQILINTTAPSALKFKDAGRTAYEGSEGTDNVVRINTTLTNPFVSSNTYKNLAVVIYSKGFETQRQTDRGNWIVYDNNDPLFTDIVDLAPGENRVTYFDFKFEPKNEAQLGSFVTKVYNMDETVNELGSYAEEYCLGTTENFIVLPGTNAELPAITLNSLEPEILYNQGIRYLTVTGRGMEFFRSDLLNKIELRGDSGIVYDVSADNISYEQSDDPNSISIMLDEYMETGRYQLHFLWKNATGETALQGVPEDFTGDGMYVHMSSDKKYSNAHYGIVTVQRDAGNKYKVVPYKNEAALAAALKADSPKEKDLLLTFRGEILKENDKNYYRMMGKDSDVNINYMLNYHGSDFTIEQKNNGTVEVLMDGKITTVGANTTVRNGTAAFRLNSGTEYIVPIYNEDGEVEENGSLSGNKDFIQLKWDNAFDTLVTVGGFLIDMRYGILGKMQETNEDDEEILTDIISFGGSLDLGFMTPGGAAQARKNKDNVNGNKWTLKGTEIKDDDEDGFGFGLTFDEESGEFRSQGEEADIPPQNEDPDRVEFGANIHDVLFGGSDPGYIGINMDTHLALPNIVSFLPDKIEGDLAINTIGGYQVEVNGSAETAMFNMAVSFVIKSNPKGEPIPDKLFFSIGGFEPGINVGGAGVVWITGGGGGIDKLYDTIYGKDGVPPLTLLLHVEFDITKVMTGNADLELSLRSISMEFSDLSLKKLKDAKFLDGGRVAIGWYPNFSFDMQAAVNFMQLFKGSIQISAAAGGQKDFIEFMLSVAIELPKYIPLVGGMQLASAELGGGTEKVWGSVELLSLIKVGFTYYWGAGIEFTHGNASGTQNFAAARARATGGNVRTAMLADSLAEPVDIGKAPVSGNQQYVSMGGNLSYVAGSMLISDFDERVKQATQPTVKLMDSGAAFGGSASANSAATQVYTNNDRTSHLVSFGDAADYILTVSLTDGKEIDTAALKTALTAKMGADTYSLNYYTAPGEGASDEAKTAALKAANVNIAGGIAYIAVPKSKLAAGRNLLLTFTDGKAYDVGVIRVEEISSLTSQEAKLSGDELTVNWTGTNLSDTAKILVYASDIPGEKGIILNTDEISAKYSGVKGEVKITLPSGLASGSYHITVVLSDEDICHDSYDAGSINVVNSKAPSAPGSVSLANAGNDKLKINVASAGNADGFLVDVYENGMLIQAGLYFDKSDELLIGGRYEIPVYDEDGNYTGNSQTVGYTPGKSYSVKVRAANLEDPDDKIIGDEIYHCSGYTVSDSVQLAAAQPPVVQIAYDKSSGQVSIEADTEITGELYINGDVSTGKWFEFKQAAQKLTKKLDLADGEYILEFHAVNAKGDKSMARETVSVDTTAPVVLLESPISGGTFNGDRLHVKGVAESDATYTFKIDGAAVTPIGGEIFKDGLMDCYLPLTGAGTKDGIVLTIKAVDKGGNETEKMVMLSNSELSKIKSVTLCAGGSPVTGGVLAMQENTGKKIGVKASLENGGTVDVTGSAAVSCEVIGGSSAKIENGMITAVGTGQTLISVSYDLGGGRKLTDAVVVQVGDNSGNDTALKAALNEAKSVTNNGYTAESWQALQDAIAEAENLLAAGNATQEMLDSATAAVKAAKAGLKKSGGTGGSGGSGAVGASNINVEDSIGGSVTIEPKNAASGEKVTITVKPDEGYVLDKLKVTDKNGKDIQLTEKDGKYTFIMPSTNVTVKALFSEAASQDGENLPFIDVNKGDWFFESIAYAYKNGLMNGISATIFSPNAETTRGMIVTILYRLEGSPAVGGSASDKLSADTGYTDVAAGKWYTDAVAWAGGNGIVKGYSDGTFRPNDKITRQELAAMLYRYSQFKGYDISKMNELSAYTDKNEIGSWAMDSLKWANAQGLVKGRTETTIAPRGNATRAEAAAMLMRFAENVAKQTKD